MTIYITQIYIRPGISYPFSLRFQKWFGAQLSQRVEASEAHRRAYGADCKLGIVVSAKADIHAPEIKGPTVFKRDKHVEFTIFLPFKGRDYQSADDCREIIELLIPGVIDILDRLQLDSTRISNDAKAILANFLVTPGLVEAPKPTASGL